MVNECLIFKMPLVKKEEEKGPDGIELSLELSIGGNYGKGKNDESNDKSDVGQENGGGVVDLLKKREIQALRRQEARKKREEKLLKSRTGVVINGDKLVLEAQQFQSRAEGREIKENEDLCRKREKNGVRDQVDSDLNLSLFSEKKQQPFMKYPGVVPHWGLNGSGVSSMDCDSSGLSNGKNEGGGNCSLERSSSVASDYQGISLKGEINSDAGSHSSIPNTNLHLHAPRARNTYELLEGNGSSSQTEMVPSSSTPQGSDLPFKFSQQSEEDPTENQTSASMKQTSESLTERLPKPPINNNPGTSLPHMPCVSATGNGPNGKTITGFLYKYTKSEVCILCACHGSSFSPAGFVEHAGCTNVSHPLKHITIIPSTLTYRIQ